jgi:hypothetical protein
MLRDYSSQRDLESDALVRDYAPATVPALAAADDLAAGSPARVHDAKVLAAALWAHEATPLIWFFR